MSAQHECRICSVGCAARHIEENKYQDISIAPLLLGSGLLMLVVGILLKWIL